MPRTVLQVGIEAEATGKGGVKGSPCRKKALTLEGNCLGGGDSPWKKYIKQELNGKNEKEKQSLEFTSKRGKNTRTNNSPSTKD